MSGICGFWFRNCRGGVTTPLQDMLELISYRGADDSGIYLDSQVGLGINRVAILDQRKGLYPIHNEDKSKYLILDGEIYNFKAIKTQLLNSGHKFYTETSEEIILHLYEEKGVSFIKELNGNFAFAIWDNKNKNLLLARDRFGIKPLYYWMDDEKLIFGSEIKVFFLDKSVPKEPNDSIIYDFLMTGVHEHTEWTFFKGVKKLMPGEYALIGQNGIKIGKYWKLEKKPENFDNEKEITQKFLELFETSIKLRLIGTSLSASSYRGVGTDYNLSLHKGRPAVAGLPLKVGALLSGGLDSSTVVGMLNKFAQPITFSSCREDLYLDERKYISALTNMWGLKSNHIFPKSSQLWVEFSEFIRHQEEPIRGASTWDHFSVMRLAQGAGIKILFDGQGGDEILYGYIGYFPQFLWQIKFNIPKFIKEFIAGMDLVNFAIRERLLGRQKPQKFLSPYFAHEFKDRERQILSELFPDTLSEKSYYAITKYSLPFLLKETERNASAFGIETRLPFLDNELVEFLFSLPLRYKIRNGWTKWLLRQAMQNILPPLVINRRRKIGFGTPESRWLKELRREVESLFNSSEFNTRPYWNGSKNLLQSFREFCAGRKLQSDFFWRVISTEIWLRTFFG